MAFITVPNVAIRGISACVPEHVEENISLDVFSDGDAPRVIAQTGIERKHTAEAKTVLSDLCEKAFNGLIEDLKWEKESIDLLVLVASAGDYITPSTSNYLHGRLELSESCIAFDIRQGCPGWVVGLDVVSSMITSGNIKRAILLCGDLSTKLSSPKDKETKPLFGDAVTATALEYDPTAPEIQFHHGTKGKDFDSIITYDGGFMNPITEESLKYIEYGNNQMRRGIDCKMDGMNVFSFGISTAPKSVSALCENFGIDLNSVDYCLFHQANKYMNDKIRKKLKIDEAKVPSSLRDFGNTSGASIPLTIVTQCRDDFSSRPLDIIACAFGVGLAWASVHFKTNRIVCPKLIMY